MAEKQVLEWIEFSQRDFDSASFLMNMRPLPCEVICYLCQQSAEKSLKALMLFYEFPIEKTHDLLALSKILQDKIDVSSLKLQCASLTNYATVVRYPYSSISQIDESQTKTALSQAKQILDFVNNIVSIDKT